MPGLSEMIIQKYFDNPNIHVLIIGHIPKHRQINQIKGYSPVEDSRVLPILRDLHSKATDKGQSSRTDTSMCT